MKTYNSVSCSLALLVVGTLGYYVADTDDHAISPRGFLDEHPKIPGIAKQASKMSL